MSADERYDRGVDARDLYEQIPAPETEEAVLSLQPSADGNRGSLLPLHPLRLVSVWLQFSLISRFWQEI